MSRKKKLLLVALVMAGVCALPLSIAGCKNKGNNGTNIGENPTPLGPEAGCKHENMSHEAETFSNCSTPGHQEYWYCSDCIKYYTDAEGKNVTTLTALTKALDNTRHNYGDWVDAEPATCSETGLAAHYECEDCHHYFDADYEEVTKASLVIDIDAEAHDWKLESETPATCTADGLKTYVCNHDHAHTKTEVIKSVGHRWSVGHVTKKATCTEKGILSFTCIANDDCGATKTEDIPALGHDWTEYEYVAAEGVYKRTCKHSEGDDRHEACAAFETIVAGSSEAYPIPVATAAELNAALEKGGYIKLTADIEVTDGSTLTVAKAANLDLNNHEIKTNSGESILINTAEAVVIRNGKISTASTERAGKIIHLAASSDKVTLSGLTVSGVSGDTYYGIYGVRIEENANAQITGCNLSGLSYAIALSGNGAKVTVNGGSIKNSQVGVTGNGKFDNNAITLTDLTVNAVDTAVYNPQGGTTIITRGTYTAEIGCALEVRAGAVTVTNATLAATGEFSKAPNGSGTTITGTAIGVSQHNTDKTIRLAVSGSSLSGVCAIFEKDVQNDTKRDQIQILLGNDNDITGCVYSQNNELKGEQHVGELSNAWIYNAEKAVYEKFCDNCGEVAETLAAGTEEMPCLVNDAASLKVALENGGHIKFTADAAIDELVNINADTVIDLNGKTLSITTGAGRPLTVAEGVTLTVNNGNMVIPEDNIYSYGIISLSENSKAHLTGVNMTGNTDAGALIRGANLQNCEVTLDNCSATTNYLIVILYSVANGKLTVNGGEYKLITKDSTLSTGDKSDFFAGFKLSGKLTDKVVGAEEPVYDLTAEFDGVTINSGSRLGCEIGAAKAVFNDCTIGNPQNNGVYGYLESAIATCSVGHVVINSGSYSGKYAAYTFNSAGTIEINGGTFNGNFQADVSAGCLGDAKIILNETETPIVWDTTKYKYSAGGSSDTYKSYFIKNVSTAAGLTEAVKTNGTVVLNEDITADVVIAKGVNVTIDLNGHTLDNDKSHTIVNHGTLNLIDSKGNGKVYNGTHAKASLENKGKAVVDGVTFERAFAKDEAGKATNSYYTVHNNGKDLEGVELTLKNVTVSTDPADDFSSLVRNYYATMTIESGTYTSAKIAVKNDEMAVLNIKGGEFDGGAKQCFQNYGKATITGGTFRGIMSTNAYEEYIGETIIEGGTISPDQNFFYYENAAAASAPVIKIANGITVNEPTFTIFDAAYNKTNSRGYSVVKTDNDGNVEYTLSRPAFVSNEAELKAAAAKEEGCYIKVLNDITVNDFINVGYSNIAADYTIDLSNHTITSNVDTGLCINNGANVVIKNGTITTLGYWTANGYNYNNGILIYDYNTELNAGLKATVLLNNVVVNANAEGINGNAISLANADLTIVGSVLNASYVGVNNSVSNSTLTVENTNITATRGILARIPTVIKGGEIKTSGLGIQTYCADLNWAKENLKLTISGNAKITSTANEAIKMYTNTNAEISNATITGNVSGVSVLSGTKLTMKDCNITGQTYAVVGNGSNGQGNTDITLTDCNLEGLYGIYHPQIGGKLQVTRGTITATGTGIEVRAGEVTLNNVQIESSATEFAAEANGNGTTTKGVALTVSQHNTQDKIVVTLNGTTLNGIYALYEKDLMDETTPKDITININEGNRFNGCVYSDNCKNVDKVDANLGEWTYADGNYTREDGATVVAGSSECFPVLVDGDGETALMAVLENGGYVKLTDNVTTTQTGEKQVNKKVIVDLNGKTLTCVKDSAFAVVNGGELSFVNGNLVMSTSATSNASIAVEKGSSVTLDGATLTTNCYGIFPAGNAASVTVKNNSVIRSTGATCISTNSKTTENYNVVITVEDSILYGFTEAVILNVPGKFNAKNSQFYGINEAVFVRAGTAKLENCILQNNINGVDENGELKIAVPVELNANTFNAYYVITNKESWGNGSKFIPLNTLVVGSGKPGYSNQVSCELVNCTLIDGFVGIKDETSKKAEDFKHHLIYATTDVKDSAAKATVTYDAATAEKSNFTDSNVKAETGSNAKITPVTEEEVA